MITIISVTKFPSQTKSLIFQFTKNSNRVGVLLRGGKLKFHLLRHPMTIYENEKN